ncbi:hypothetical protein ACFL2V_01590 [Pseudomonadota bacterium]
MSTEPSVKKMDKTTKGEQVPSRQFQADKLQETQKALNDIKEGRTINGHEVMKWLDSWGAEEETSLPINQSGIDKLDK